MSDGPYRSLPMARYWKRTARLAESDASDEAEISAAFIHALAKETLECSLQSFLEKAVSILSSPSLFTKDSLESLRKIAPGRPMINLFLDFLDLCKASSTIKDQIKAAVTAMLVERSDRAIRQMREHYLRDKNRTRARHTIDRIVRALRKDGLNDLANRLMENNLRPILTRKPKSGINDGVRI